MNMGLNQENLFNEKSYISNNNKKDLAFNYYFGNNSFQNINLDSQIMNNLDDSKLFQTYSQNQEYKNSPNIQHFNV